MIYCENHYYQNQYQEAAGKKWLYCVARFLTVKPGVIFLHPIFKSSTICTILIYFALSICPWLTEINPFATQMTVCYIQILVKIPFCCFGSLNWRVFCLVFMIVWRYLSSHYYLADGFRLETFWLLFHQGKMCMRWIGD